MGVNPLSHFISSYPDFPKPGILFRDISPVLASPEAMDLLVAQFEEKLAPFKPDLFAGIESRGFLFSTLMARTFNTGSLMIRKPGKLPGKLIQKSYALEYGENTLAIQANAPVEGKRVIIIDDLLATGGTIRAAASLLTERGARPVATGVVVELTGLKGRDTLPTEVISLVSYDD